MLEIRNMTKSYGEQLAINNISFVAEDGKVTGFVGPNGSGKSTALYCALGLMKTNSGRAYFDGMPYEGLQSPIETVGSVLDIKIEDYNRSAINHLNAFAAVYGIPKSRVLEVLNIAGISSIKNMDIKSMSAGMRKRLSVATALLADPHNLILDEPFHGLDADGVRWMRDLCKYYARRGGAVLLSSNTISEIANVADNLVIIAHGNILQQTTTKKFIESYSQYASVRVITPEPEKLLDIMQSQYRECTVTKVVHKNEDVQAGTAFVINNADITSLSQSFANKQLITYQINNEHIPLEDAYLAMTAKHARFVSMPTSAYKSMENGATAQTQYMQQQQMQYVQTQPVQPAQPAQPVQPAQPTARHSQQYKQSQYDQQQYAHPQFAQSLKEQKTQYIPQSQQSIQGEAR